MSEPEIVAKPKRWPSEKQLTDRARTLLSGHLEPGSRIANEYLMAALECRDLPRAQAALRRARRWMLKTHHRWVKSEPGHGYIVIASADHAEEAKKYRSQGRRRLRVSFNILTQTRLEEITDPKAIEAWLRERNIVGLTLWTERRASRNTALAAAGDIKALPAPGALLRMIDGSRRKPKAATA